MISCNREGAHNITTKRLSVCTCIIFPAMRRMTGIPFSSFLAHVTFSHVPRTVLHDSCTDWPAVAALFCGPAMIAAATQAAKRTPNFRW